MERKVGEVFTYKGKIYKVVPSLNTCKGCTFNNGTVCLDEPLKSRRGKCAYRKDKQSVIFVELNNMEIKDNQLTIDIPKGMEIDTENSDLAKGIIKFKTKSLTYNDVYSAIHNTTIAVNTYFGNEIKLRALVKLMNIAKHYNGDWKPDWNNNLELKYSIFKIVNRYEVMHSDICCKAIVYFKNRYDAEAVVNNPNFRDILDTVYKN